MYNEKMRKLGEERSDIRELFEYGNARKKEIGSENVFDFSLGNPGVPAPACVQEEVERLLRETPAVALHGYSSAPGLFEVRKAVSNYIQSEFGAEMRPELVYMTCGASASLTVILNAILNAGDEVVTLAPFFPNTACSSSGRGERLSLRRRTKNSTSTPKNSNPMSENAPRRCF